MTYLCGVIIRDNLKTNTMKSQVGKYFFGRHRGDWRIWLCTAVTETGSSETFVKDVYTYEEAVKEVYRLNGWGEPKSIKRNF